MRGRVLRRPVGGWGARSWRRGASAGLLAAFWYLAVGLSCQTMLNLIDFAAIELRAIW